MNEFSIFNDRRFPDENRTEQNRSETEKIAESPTGNENPPINPVNQPPVPVTQAPIQPPLSANTNNESAGLVQIPQRTFEHDLAIGDRFQNLSGEVLRLALLGIGAVGFLLLNFLFSGSEKTPDAVGIVKKTLANPDFRFYVYATLFLFGLSAGLALLHRYFTADAAAYHLKYLRLQEKLRLSRETQTLENVSHLIPHSRRGFFDGFWLYLIGSETDELQQRVENEKDARNFLFKITRWLLFLSGLLLWLGAFSLILALGVIFR